ELAGCPPHELVAGMSFEEVLEAAPEVWHSPADVEERLAQYRQGGTCERMLPGGRWVRIADRRTARGGTITMHVDITDLKMREAELAAVVDEKSILMRELEHRIFNTLNTVQAIARQTRETSATPEAFAEAFESRLGALARAHQALTKGQWRAADLHTLVADTLAPFVGSDAAQRLEVSGTRILVPARLALALSLALHELATNAMKHGAWKGPAGRVEIRFGLSAENGERGLQLLWREHAVRPAEPLGPPGFGSVLIQEGLAYQFRGRAHMTVEADGIAWHLFVPWPQTASSAAAPTGPAPG